MASQDTTASLVTRLAGPSTTKAGLSKDQSEINRVIAEASKGSKFYENEKRKDKILTERIAKLLKHRDEVMKGVDISRVETAADHLIAELESQRDLSQYIVHVDMDAFYCSVELLDNRALSGKPFAVGGLSMLSTASYDARKYGVRSGMPGFIAKKLCPDLILLPHHFPRYMELSKKVMDIFRRYDPDMQAAGCDEGYLNITEYCKTHDIAVNDCVQQMRDIVREETNLTVSAGIAPNKMLAKICSDQNKPNGQFHLSFDPTAIRAYMKELSVRKIPGIGRVQERLFDSIGIKTCGDIYTQRATISLMDKEFGLRPMLCAYLGLGSNIVQPSARDERKSIGAERTFNSLGDKEKILQKLEEVAEELESDMEKGGWAGKTVTLKFKLSTYEVFTRAKSFDRWITKKQDLFNTGKELLMSEFPVSLRLIGLRVTKLKDLKADHYVGIKRFFESMDDSAANKRQKLYSSSSRHGDGHDHSTSTYEHELPAFFLDEQEDDIEDHPGDVNQDCHPDRGSASPPPAGFASPSSKKPTSKRKPNFIERTNHDRKPASTKETPVCPICYRALDIDNQGLNEHVDFCLSKQAIKEAQTAAAIKDRKPRTAM